MYNTEVGPQAPIDPSGPARKTDASRVKSAVM
jgi:hypothetical protein